MPTTSRFFALVLIILTGCEGLSGGDERSWIRGGPGTADDAIPVQTTVGCAGVDSSGSCAGHLLTFCAGGVQSSYDCAALGRECQVSSAGFSDCVLPTSTGRAPPPVTPMGPEAEQRAAAGGSAAEAASTFESLVASGEADPVGALINVLKADPAWSDVSLSPDGGTVLGRHQGGLWLGVLTDQKSRSEWMDVSSAGKPGLAETTGALETDNGAVDCLAAKYPQSKIACVVSGFQSEFAQNTAAIEGSLSKAGFAVKHFPIGSPSDVANLRSQLNHCGVLYISSHGDVQKGLDGTMGVSITTEIELIGDTENPKLRQSIADMTAEFGADLIGWFGVVGHKGKAYWSITPDFFASANLPNSLVYVDTCHGGRTPSGASSLRQAFKDAGAGAFISWDGAISTRFANPAADAIFAGLAPDTEAVGSTTLSISPPDPGPGESYVPTATVSPAQEGVTIRLSVSGTDGFSRTEVATTDSAGSVTFSSVPGGKADVVDTITVVAGGAESSSTVMDVLASDPTLAKVWKLPWNPAQESFSQMVHDAEPGFNLVCNNAQLSETTEVIKF